MSDPTPERFHNFWWTIGDVMGWLADGGARAKFGRIATVADLSPPIFEDDSEACERRPEILLLRALQQGLIAHDPRAGPIAPEIWLPSMNEGDIRELFRRGASFKHDEVLARYPEATAPSLEQAEDEEIVEPALGHYPQDAALIPNSPRAAHPDVARPGPKAGEKSSKDKMCDAAVELLESGQFPPTWGRLAKIARTINPSFDKYQADSIRKRISPIIREWEQQHPGK
jgi:hypothetical protein